LGWKTSEASLQQRTAKSSAAALAFLAAACLVTPAWAQPALESGDGFKALTTVCGRCHTLELVTDRMRTSADWRRVFEKMARLGLPGSDEEVYAAGRYVRDHLTVVDVNSASAAEIARVLGLSSAAAEAIVARRGQRQFGGLDDLASVPGVDRAQLEQRKQKILF
jgi:competence ComEA-like helix-hairpin-helix protein